jgi:hydrogenase nickel incorporation protein HypA/HybF
MHELSIADSVLQVALSQAAGRPIARVGLSVGHLRQVVPQALRFSFELVARDTPADGATLEIEEIPAAGSCRACGAESQMSEFPLHCAACGGLDVTVIRGEELQVEWLDIEVPDEARDDVREPDEMSMKRG